MCSKQQLKGKITRCLKGSPSCKKHISHQHCVFAFAPLVHDQGDRYAGVRCPRVRSQSSSIQTMSKREHRSDAPGLTCGSSSVLVDDIIISLVSDGEHRPANTCFRALVSSPSVRLQPELFARNTWVGMAESRRTKSILGLNARARTFTRAVPLRSTKFPHAVDVELSLQKSCMSSKQLCSHMYEVFAASARARTFMCWTVKSLAFRGQI